MPADPMAMPASPSPVGGPSTPATWDARYREGRDGWELGHPAPPLETFLRTDHRRPAAGGTVLVPGCGRGHEAALLASLGFRAIGLDFSGEALAEARRLHGCVSTRLQWLQGDLFDRGALAAAGLGTSSLTGVVEHTCFCAIDPARRPEYLKRMRQWLAPGGWLLGLFWCHRRPGGPPWGSEPATVAAQLKATGFSAQVWEPATGSCPSREDEWIGLWRREP